MKTFHLINHPKAIRIPVSVQVNRIPLALSVLNREIISASFYIHGQNCSPVINMQPDELAPLQFMTGQKHKLTF